MPITKKRKIEISKESIARSSENNKKSDSDKENSKFYLVLSLAWELGFSVSIPLVGGALLGQYLDKRFNTLPRFTLSLIFLGILVSFVNVYFVIRRLYKD